MLPFIEDAAEVASLSAFIALIAVVGQALGAY
jgi:hypothetical protein